MNKEAAEYLVNMGQTIANNDLKYRKKVIEPVISVYTLRGICDYLTSQFDEHYLYKIAEPEKPTFLVNVISPEKVVVYSCIDNSGYKPYRQTLLESLAVSENVSKYLNYFISVDDFKIFILSCFEESDDMKFIMKILSSVVIGDDMHVVDNGITQTVRTKEKLSLSEDKEIKHLLSLYPYRTFRDIKQPSSRFFLRLRKNQNDKNGFEVGLFESDSKLWMIEAIESIKSFIIENLDTEDQDLIERISVIG